jgi:peroxiredoxin
METHALLAPRLAALREKYGSMLKPQVAAVVEDHVQSLRSSGAVDRALKAGDPAPSFTLTDGHDDVVKSAALLETGPLVISFFRGTWCPYCVTELRALAEMKHDIEARGARLIVISPQAPAERDHKIEADVGLSILYDIDNVVARSFGVAYDFPNDLQALYLNVFHNDIAKINGVERWQLPMPARYIIAPGGQIVDAKVDPDYRYRPEPSSILTILDRLTV